MIQSTTELVAIIGTPIAQVKSPDNFNHWFRETGQDTAMIAIDIQASTLELFIGAMRGWRNLRGCVVTVPHKRAAAPLLDALTPRAEALGCVNVIRREPSGRLVGDIVDGDGFLNAARDHAFVPKDKHVCVIGAGGAGSAIALSLCEAGASHVAIADIAAERAHTLVTILQSRFPAVGFTTGFDTLAAFDLVVNASPVGMGDDLALPISREMSNTLRPGCLVADVVTTPPLTPFLQVAIQMKCEVQTGPEMALGQLGMLGHFMGVTPEHL